MSETVRISVTRYASLLRKAEKLLALENGGVDNWEWYSESLQQHGYYDASANDKFKKAAEQLVAEQKEEAN